MGGSAPPVDYSGAINSVNSAAGTQLRNNRLNTSNPFASQTYNDDGTVSSQFAGGLGNAATGLMGQAGGLSKPMDWGQFGTAGTGDQARDQAVNAAYGQATSRLDPQWGQREEQLGAKLMNQGLDPNSAAYKNAMTDFSQQRNDAYGSAMNSAIGQGQAAGDSVFRNNMMSRQQQISEALQQRGMPMQELKQLQGFLGGQPEYAMDNATATGALGAAGLMGKQAEQERDRAQAQSAGDANTAAGIMGGIGTAAGIAAMFF